MLSPLWGAHGAPTHGGTSCRTGRAEPVRWMRRDGHARTEPAPRFDRYFPLPFDGGSLFHQYIVSSFFGLGQTRSSVSPSNSSPFFIT
jgi:hypothetical protein